MKRLTYVIGGLILLMIALGLAYLTFSKEKNAYVNISELYNEFEMKKELEAKYLAVENGRKAQLDSLEVELKLLNKRFQTEGTGDKDMIAVFENKREAYLLKKEQFEEDNSQMQQTYTSDIMKQLNQYVADFGKENGYSFIFGAEGSGSVMYAEQKKDITDGVKQYINNRYKGKR